MGNTQTVAGHYPPQKALLSSIFKRCDNSVQTFEYPRCNMTVSYMTIADTIAGRIHCGDMRIGERLPPQRTFAYENGIAVSTAGRVYSELVRRGLVVGEVGRGSYVRSSNPKDTDSALLETRSDCCVDLELNYPIMKQQAMLMAPALQGLTRPEALDQAIRPVRTRGTELQHHRNVASKFLCEKGWVPDPSNIMFAGSGRQAIAAAMAALVPPGGRLGVEELTYPILKGLAVQLGRRLIPIKIDNEGIVPDDLKSIHSRNPLDAIYVQPTLHNPTGRSMGLSRRSELARVLISQNLPTIEDRVYRFLTTENVPSLANLAPDQTLTIDSLSKRLAPGLTLGIITSPGHLADSVSLALNQCGWIGTRFAIEAATRWINSGIISKIDKLKRHDVTRRQAIAQKVFGDFVSQSSEHSYHIWITLPSAKRADVLVREAADKGIAIAMGSAFAIEAGQAGQNIRIALASPPLDQLEQALMIIQKLMAGDD